MTRKQITSFYETHSRRLFNISRRILQNSEDAEEVMHDTILKYVSTPFKPLTQEQVSAWLARTCIRASVDRLRKRRREALFLEEYAHEAAEADDVGSFEAYSPEMILGAMRQLDDPYRLIVTLVLIEGLDYQEISAYTGMKETTIRSAFSRGKHKLGEILKDGKPL